MRELSVNEIEQVSGGNGCTYDSKNYSNGSRKKQEGKVMVCTDGKWVAEKSKVDKL